jgi:hypothetical protein
MMENAKFWASLEISQYGLDMTSSAFVILMLAIQMILVAGESAVGLVVEKQLLAIIWILVANKPACVRIHISSRKSTNLLPRDFKQFCKT